MAPQVKSIRITGDRVEVDFADGHQATFAVNPSGLESYDNVERLWLKAGNQTVAMFHSLHQHPVNHRPAGITQLAQGYSIERVTTYWRAAYDYVAAGSRNGQLTDAWDIVSASRKDILELEGNVWPSPR